MRLPLKVRTLTLHMSTSSTASIAYLLFCNIVDQARLYHWSRDVKPVSVIKSLFLIKPLFRCSALPLLRTLLRTISVPVVDALLCASGIRLGHSVFLGVPPSSLTPPQTLFFMSPLVYGAQTSQRLAA
jgi:hypothetical protein